MAAFQAGPELPGGEDPPIEGNETTESEFDTEIGFLPSHPSRRPTESAFVRVIATAGVIGIGTALGAVLSASDAAGWIIGVVVSVVSVALAAILWRSRTL